MCEGIDIGVVSVVREGVSGCEIHYVCAGRGGVTSSVMEGCVHVACDMTILSVYIQSCICKVYTCT